MTTAAQRDMLRRIFGLLVAMVLLGAGLTTVMALSFSTTADAAEPTPPPLLQRNEDVVTSDPLPTVQIDDGYVWAQTTIGSTVFAAGDFDNARAPLAAPGTQLTPRSNILAYDINTGGLLPFAPQVNGVIKAIAASPDGTRIYIAGTFSSVNGQTRWNIAALDAITGQLVPGFQPAIGGTGVYALVAHDSMVYAGGLFTQANGVGRQNVAAFAASSGALMPWAPQTDRQVDAMVADPGGEKIVIAGRFSEVNGNTSMRGAAAIDELTGAVDADWLLPQTVKNGMGSGPSRGKAGIFALAADDNAVYGTGWVYASLAVGNLEGTFAAEADTGEVRWIADCLGDHYGVYSTGTTVYTTSHTHACSTMSLHPEQSPRNHTYMEAYTADARGLLGHQPAAGSTYQDWYGTPAPSPYAFYPDFYVGTTSGLGQAGLSITGVGDIISVAGEFVGVNNQQFAGIVRFSTNPPQGAQDGPRLSGADWQATATSFIPGRVRVAVPGNWDRDDLNLTYELYRTGSSSPVATKTVPSTWWEQPGVLLEDTSATPGSSVSYAVVVRDGDGNSVTSSPVSTIVADGTAAEYTTAIIDAAPLHYYPLGDTMQDWAGANAPVPGSGVSAETPGIANSATGYSDFDGASSGRVVTSSTTPAPEEFSTELWFRTSTVAGGKLIGYGNSDSGDSSSYDRHVYMSALGRIVFGVYPGAARTIESGAGYNDGQWHHVVASQSAEGMELYLDGALVASDPTVTTAQDYSGRWRIGGDNLSGWPSRPISNYFDGAIDEVAIYDRALEAQEVTTHFGIGQGLEAPTAAFAATTDGLDVSVDASDSAAADGSTLVEHRWDFGDGSGEVTGSTASHTYGATGTYTVTLTVEDSNGLSATSVQTVDVLGPNTLPSAGIATETTGLTVTADGSGSTDADGQIVTYEWDWGDGEASTGQVATHAYAAAGDYTVTLTVTDDRGGSAQTTETVTAAHADPTAQFTLAASGLTVDVDATGSSASDGASLSFTWDWGDGTATSTGSTASHTYANAGDYTVTLTVTDSLGAAADHVEPASVTSETFAAADTFERTVGSGWGAADVGGAWTSAGWGGVTTSVGDGVGTVSVAPGTGRDMLLGGLSVTDSQTSMTYSLESGPSSGSMYLGLASRIGDDSEYRSLAWHRADGSVWLLIQRDGAVMAALPMDQQWAAGDTFHLRTEVIGETSPTIRVSLWPEGAAEPAEWQLEVTDTDAQALTAPGAASVYVYRSGSATGDAPVHVDDYYLSDRTGDPAEPVPNVDPVADLTWSITGLEIAVDGTPSTDEDGELTAYSWDFGDGTTAEGQSAEHEYTTAGTYPVTLTVTDDDDATHSVTRTVSVTSEVFAASDAFERTVSSGWGAADVGGAWTSSGWGAVSTSVGDGVGTVSVAPGTGRTMVLGEMSLADSATEMTYTLDSGPSTGAVYVGLGSRIGNDSEYRSLAWHRADGSVWLLIQRDGAVMAALPMDQQWATGDTFHLRTEVIGATTPTIRVSLWPQGAAEPTEWQLEVTDTDAQALTAPGAASVYVYRAGSATGDAPLHVDDYHLSDRTGTVAAAQRATIVPGGGAVATEPEAIAPDTGTDEETKPAKSPVSPAEPVQSSEVENAPAGPDSPPAPDDPVTVEEPEPADPASEEDPAPAEEPAEAPQRETVDGEPVTDDETATPGEGSEAAAEGSGNGDDAASDAPSGSEDAPAEEVPADHAPPTGITDPAEDKDPEPRSRVEDRFDRNAESGWGEADHGGAWVLTDDSEATLSVADGIGHLGLAPGTTAHVLLDGPAATTASGELTFRIKEDGEPGDIDVGMLLGQDAESRYRIQASMRSDGSIWLTAHQGEDLVVEQQLEEMTYEPGTMYTLAVSSTEKDGTALAAKLWETQREEPEDWQLSVPAGDIHPLPDDSTIGLSVTRADGGGEQGGVALEEFTATLQG